MSADASQETTRLLAALNQGDSAAAEKLLPLVYDQLRALAANYLRRERTDHTLQPTALVHEAYLRLVEQSGANWKDEAHFLAIAARAMRNVLINHGVARRALKRGGGRPALLLNEELAPAKTRTVDALKLDEALQKLAAMDARKAKVVELRFFGGLTVEQTAHVLGVSDGTVETDWRVAKAWLSKELADR